MKLNERKLTKAEVSKREDIIMDMKKNKRELTKRYGKDAEKVMYGRATNLAKKQLENMDPKSKLREMVKNALSSPKLTNEKFSKKYDDDPALKGGQKNLPDALQKSIIDEIEVDDSYSERETMGMEYNQNPEKFLDSIISILNKFSNGGKFNSSNVDSNYLNTFELEGSPLKVGLNKEFSFDLLSGEKMLMSNKNLDTILLASEKHSPLKEGSEDQYPSFEVDKNIKYQDMNITKGYWSYTGKESGGRGVYLNVMNQQRLGFNMDDINFFKTKLQNHFQINEDLDLGHQDDEPHMLKANLYRIGKYAMELYQMMDKFEGQGEVDLPHWWQSKIIKSESMITSAKHYLDFELKEPEIDAMVDVAGEEGAINEAQKYDIEASLRSIRDFNRNESDDIEGLARNIIKNLGYKVNDINIDNTISHLTMSTDGTDRLPVDSTVVRELYSILNEGGAISEEKSQMPSQKEVDRFFEETFNEMHYLASKPVMGQEKTFNNTEIEAWDEYDLSNWNALNRKKKEGKSPFGESKYSQLAEKIAKNLKKSK